MKRPDASALKVVLMPAMLFGVTFAYGVGFGRYRWWPSELLTEFREQAFPRVAAPADAASFRTPTVKYSRISSIHAELPCRPIVFLGDSLVEECPWDELFDSELISNRGISGDTTFGVSQRIAGVLTHRPALLAVWVGVNDLSRGMSLQDSADALGSIIAATASSQTKLIVLTICPASESLPELNQRAELQNAEIRRACRNSGVPVIELSEVISPAEMSTSALSNDGVHLTGSGYARVYIALLPALQQAIRKTQ